MPFLKTILVVDDNAINRAILTKILSKDYLVLQAENGKEALKILNDEVKRIFAIMLDLVMPIMDGYLFLERVNSDSKFSNLPIIVTTGNNDNQNEIRALKLGAWDFVSKPYNAEIIKFRLKNAIDRSQLTAFNQLKYLAEYDELTDIYNKTKFFQATKMMLEFNAEKSFVYFRFDIDRFQLINSFFGTEEGDKLIIFIASCFKRIALGLSYCTYGRMESDIFSLCAIKDEIDPKNITEELRKDLANYNPNYDIVPSLGVYYIEDSDISVETMYNRATLAAKKCKGNYIDCYSIYNESLSLEITREQEIVNEMNFALANNQFCVYYQPKFSLQSSLPFGAEALVRWIHPVKGLLSPAEFIPIFERNGFITKLDYYVWESVCKQLRKWLDSGLNPLPISVNVSRVNLYNPKLVDNIIGLIEKYNIEPKLLNLELTETAYTDNPTIMEETMTKLQSYGFIIMMDDFGSGYSSLNVLKDIAVDVLKIDMRFLSKTKIEGRGENIIASIVRMAKWLNIPIIAEGVETAEQVEFLKSVGSDFAQGFYFARPMTAADYEKLCFLQYKDDSEKLKKEDDINFNTDELFSTNPQMKILFGNCMQAIAIYEFKDENLEIVRVNNAYYELFGYNDTALKMSTPIKLIEQKYRKQFLNACKKAISTKEKSECEFIRNCINGKAIWVYLKLKYVTSIGNKHILIGALTDVTVQKEIDYELQKYRNLMISHEQNSNTMLIIDGNDSNELENIFSTKFIIKEAYNIDLAIECLNNNCNQIDVILIDACSTKINIKNFLDYKAKDTKSSYIPIMLIIDKACKERLNEITFEEYDCIVKPIIPESILKKVDSVVEANSRFRKIIKEYSNIANQAKIDQMTGLSNRTSAENDISEILSNNNGDIYAMLMFDIDNFKSINDTYGHAYGDEILKKIANKLQESKTNNEIITRMGGDEFAVFFTKVASLKEVSVKAKNIAKNISTIEIAANIFATCSIGIAISPNDGVTFEELYKNSDKALYVAKKQGKNRIKFFKED